MSRLAKKPIPIPEKVSVSVAAGCVSVAGPLGTLKRNFPLSVGIKSGADGVVVSAEDTALQTKMLVGTAVAHISNMIAGVREPFVKKLIVEGIGFKAELKGAALVLSLGFSHPVTVAIPENINAAVSKNIITISGSDIEAVGTFAARIRAQKKPEPYKGKGIRYEGEVIRRKQGKKTT